MPPKNPPNPSRKRTFRHDHSCPCKPCSLHRQFATQMRYNKRGIQILHHHAHHLPNFESTFQYELYQIEDSKAQLKEDDDHLKEMDRRIGELEREFMRVQGGVEGVMREVWWGTYEGSGEVKREWKEELEWDGAKENLERRDEEEMKGRSERGMEEEMEGEMEGEMEDWREFLDEAGLGK